MLSICNNKIFLFQFFQHDKNGQQAKKTKCMTNAQKELINYYNWNFDIQWCVATLWESYQKTMFKLLFGFNKPLAILATGPVYEWAQQLSQLPTGM